ncbi:site-specific integrase [Breoghania sp.]|uniref:site-specific integrase n=1 Tax=Breoghania sp. TaxID=2065378 RepID=UPI002AA61880|nr:site-specific integrase [Breoghania sp.]
MATVRKRGEKWQVQVRRKGAHGLSKSFLNKRDAEVWARQQEAACDLGRSDLARNCSLTLSELLTRYRAEITPAKKGCDTEARRLARLQKDAISKLPLTALDGQTLSKFRDRRQKDGVRACQYDLVLIRHAIEIGRKEWGITLPGNPVDQIRVPNGIRARERRLEPAEYERLKEAAIGRRNKFVWPAVNLALETAMRRSELLRLQWSDVDLSLGLAHLADTKNGHPRSVPLSAGAAAILKALPRRQSEVLPLSETALRQAWERLVVRAEVVDLHFHDLRHEAISRFFEAGLSIAEVALISGHRDPRMLFRYTHLKPEAVARKLKELVA